MTPLLCNDLLCLLLKLKSIFSDISVTSPAFFFKEKKDFKVYYLLIGEFNPFIFKVIIEK